MSLPVATVAPPADSVAGPRNGQALSPFHVAAVAFQRARQLQAGARPRVESTSRSPTRLALLEVLADTISWTVMPVAENAVNKDG
jgi:DNA-directed RNA polymerase subunit K/omega